jgi:hypothetical protein
MKNLIFAIALVGLVAACKSTNKTSITDPAGANMPAAGGCSEKSGTCTPEQKAACEGKKASGCEGMKSEAAKTCPASKPQG